MSALDTHYIVLLQRNLTEKYVAHLPPLLAQGKPADQLEKKNLSRAFSAFALHHLTDVAESEAAHAVVDDFDDVGLDAIYYHASTETVYLVQSKLKVSEQFSQDEALAFCQGVRKLLVQDFSGFNKHVQSRLVEIEDALDNCKSIQLVVAHTGSGISNHAKVAVEELLKDDTHGEERLKPNIIDFDAARIVPGLQNSQAYKRVDAMIVVRKCDKVVEPKITYFGLANLSDLVALHKKHDKALYEKNIRTFLGHTTDVNASIRKTLAENPEHFLYLNNGVTVLCQRIEPKSTKKEGKKLVITGFSVVNGAQTIASSAKFVSDNPGVSIERARVSITLIQADADGAFGKSVTRARNHQNPVLFTNFVALEDGQERLRRDLAHLGIHYVYKAGAVINPLADPSCIRAEEAAHALALFHPDPRFMVWVKKEPASLLDTSSNRYKELFTPELTAFQLANAVFFWRYIENKMLSEARGVGPEKLTYKHGGYVFGWVFAKRVMKARNSTDLFNSSKLFSQLSTHADNLRQALWDVTKSRLGSKTPLSIFRNQAYTIPLLIELAIKYYELSSDPAVIAKQTTVSTMQAYPEQELTQYLISKAPQIEGLT